MSTTNPPALKTPTLAATANKALSFAEGATKAPASKTASSAGKRSMSASRRRHAACSVGWLAWLLETTARWRARRTTAGSVSGSTPAFRQSLIPCSIA